MKKCVAILLTLILIYCHSLTPVYAVETWTAKNMNDDVLKFMLELDKAHYFYEEQPYADVLHLTVRVGEPNISSKRVYTLLRYFTSVSENGSLCDALGTEGSGLYEALGYANYQACKDLASAEPVPTDFKAVQMYSYVDILENSSVKTRNVHGYGSGYSTDGKGHGVLQSNTAVVKAVECSGTVYWFVLPGYNDYAISDNTMKLFDYNNHKVNADFDVSTCLKDYAKSPESNQLKDLSVWRFDVPGHIYTAEQLDNMSSSQLLKEFKLWRQESALYWNNYYIPYYTLEDINCANDLFIEYIGYGSDELYTYFGE